jgi:triacylglycerol lipase
MSQAQIERTRQAAPVSDDRRRPAVKSTRGRVGSAGALVGAIGRAAMVHASEAALMASLAAKVPIRAVGSGLDSARGPLPPSQPQTAFPAPPVLLVHGFCGTKSSWSLVARTLNARGLTCDAITYAPFGASVEQLADRLVAEVERILARTGADKVHLVGHSLGGVIIAQAIADGGLNGLVDTVVTLGSPFGGSPWANLLPFGIARALREGSPLLRRLASSPAPEGVRWLAFMAPLDIIVPGLRSLPANARVETVTVDGVGHLGMLVSRQVVDHIIDALAACGIDAMHA